MCTRINCKGKKFKVVSDYHNLFGIGSIVIALDDSECPWCISEDKFKEEMLTWDIYRVIDEEDVYSMYLDSEITEIIE